MAYTLFERFETTSDPDGEQISATTDWWAQTFKVGITGDNVDFIPREVWMRTESGTETVGNFTVGIWSVDPATGKPDQALATGTIAFSNMIFGWNRINLNASNALTLQQNVTYAIVCYDTAVSGGNGTVLKGDGTANYTGGVIYNSTDSGATWGTAAFAVNDFNFRIYGSQWVISDLVTYDDILTKIGAGANATASGQDFVRNYARNALATLNCRTTHNWTDEASTLSEDTKYFLTEIISSMAAIDVVNYDVTGYESRLEAQQIIDNLREIVEKYTEELKDTNVQTTLING